MFSVIFEVRPGDGRKEAYLGLAQELKPILESIDGFIDNERFESRSRPGWMLSHSTWRDEKSVIRWRTQAQHHLGQEKGRFEVFADYHLRVGEITGDTRPPAGVTVREQRFDATEVGRAPCCTILELTPDDGVDPPGDRNAVLQATLLPGATPGLDEVQLYDSIYNPGKMLVLGSWLDPEAAAAWRPDAVAGVKTLRRRVVRIIRDYGMADRREAPQYYPDVKRMA